MKEALILFGLVLIVSTVLISGCVAIESFLDPCVRQFEDCKYSCGEGTLGGYCKDLCAVQYNSCKGGQYSSGQVSGNSEVAEPQKTQETYTKSGCTSGNLYIAPADWFYAGDGTLTLILENRVGETITLSNVKATVSGTSQSTATTESISSGTKSTAITISGLPSIPTDEIKTINLEIDYTIPTGVAGTRIYTCTVSGKDDFDTENLEKLIEEAEEKISEAERALGTSFAVVTAEGTPTEDLAITIMNTGSFDINLDKIFTYVNSELKTNDATGNLESGEVKSFIIDYACNDGDILKVMDETGSSYTMSITCS